MNTEDMIQEIEKMIKKAGSNASGAVEALQYSQAACNAANALATSLHALKNSEQK